MKWHLFCFVCLCEFWWIGLHCFEHIWKYVKYILLVQMISECTPVRENLNCTYPYFNVIVVNFNKIIKEKIRKSRYLQFFYALEWIKTNKYFSTIILRHVFRFLLCKLNLQTGSVFYFLLKSYISFICHHIT